MRTVRVFMQLVKAVARIRFPESISLHFCAILRDIPAHIGGHMKQLFLCGAAALVMLMAAAKINADIARPKASPWPAKEGKIVLHTGLSVVPDANVYEARLQISQESVKDLREALASANVGSSMSRRIALSSTRTIVAGLFLFLSVSFAGVLAWRVGPRRTPHHTSVPF